MSIGISTACFYPMMTEETIPLIASLGFKKVEIFLNAESECDVELCKKMRKSLDINGLEVVSVHSFASPYEYLLLFSDYPRRRLDGHNIYKKISQAGSILGAKYITFHGDRLYTQAKTTVKRYGKVLIELMDIAQEYGLYIAQENVSWCKSSQPEFLSELIDTVDDPRLKFTLDIKQATRAGVPIEEYIRILGKKIANVHINDCNEENSCLLPGEGKMDYPKLMDDLLKCQYQGDYIIEVYSFNYKDIHQIETCKKLLETIFVTN